jgi:hypothetical protein
MSSDDPNKIYMTVDGQCPQSNNHAMGVFCQECRGIMLPWGEDLPRVDDDSGQEISKADEGTLLSGVNLRSRNAITLLSIVAHLEVMQRPHTAVEGLARMGSTYPASAEAGRRVARLWRTVANATPADEPVPQYYDIIHQALLEPFQTEDDLLLSHLAAIEETTGGASQRRGAINTHRMLRGAGLGLRQAQDLQGSDAESGDHADRGDSSNPRETDTDDGDSNDSKPRMLKRKVPKGDDKRWSRPAPRRTWEFVPGTDLEPAEVGKPNPSKFFLLRQNEADPLEKDIRQYAGWETLDWDDPNDVEDLNRARRQIRIRTLGKIAESRPTWTQREKDVLKNLVQQAINRGKHRLNIDWDEIARDMSKRFQGIIQQPGEPMAQTTKVIKGKEVKSRRKPSTLKSARTGTPKREGSAIKHQVTKFADIWVLLLGTKPLRSKVRRKRGPEPAEEENEETSVSETDSKPVPKRIKLGPKDDIPGLRKPPGPPPPPGGAGGIAGPMGKSKGLRPARTTMDAR